MGLSHPLDLDRLHLYRIHTILGEAYQRYLRKTSMFVPASKLKKRPK